MPVIRTGIAALLAESHRALVFAEHERLFALLVQRQWIGLAQIDSIMRNPERLNNFGIRVCRTNPRSQAAMALGAIAPFRQHNPCRPKQRRRLWAIIFGASIDDEHNTAPLCQGITEIESNMRTHLQ